MNFSEIDKRESTQIGQWQIQCNTTTDFQMGLGKRLCRSFKAVRDVIGSERALDAIWIGTCKEQVNVKKFRKGEGRSQKHGVGVVVLVKVKEAKKVEESHTVGKKEIIAEVEGCCIGWVTSPEIVYSLKERLCGKGITSIKVIPMGGDTVLLKPFQREDVGDLINETTSLMSNYFVQLSRWVPTTVAMERFAWVRYQVCQYMRGE
ncbi:hypothetical protein VNO78_01390 [Psophocarpus tetragonolobus]|uniref:Uncharacterized protein n=1 Tax=Psophocarpus tetragonolobus TaxID=3891 RepID=A0AAN9TAD7_PSOTE